MFECYFCEKPNTRKTFQYYCESCSQLRRCVLLHNERVYEVVNAVLNRSTEKQTLKINEELKKEIEKSNEIIKEGIKTRSMTKN